MGFGGGEAKMQVAQFDCTPTEVRVRRGGADPEGGGHRQSPAQRVHGPAALGQASNRPRP